MAEKLFNNSIVNGFIDGLINEIEIRYEISEDSRELTIYMDDRKTIFTKRDMFIDFICGMQTAISLLKTKGAL